MSIRNLTRKVGLLSLSLAAGLVLPVIQALPAEAANGDLVGTVHFSASCASGIGVGIAYDGSSLWYSCASSSTDLYRADPTTGVVSASYNIAGGLGALAYDATRNAIWAGPSGGSDYRLIQLDAGKNVVSNAVQFSGPGGLDDGLAYDGTNDTLYISPDGSTTIYHVTTTGAPLGNSAWAGNACYNSGLALGGTLLYEGSDGCSHVWVADKSNPAGPAVFDFNTAVAGDPNFRDEDLECDPNTFAASGKQVMWSVEAYEPRRASAFEIPTGSCGFGGLPGVQGFMTGGGKVSAATATATFGFELFCDKSQSPNNLQINWGKGNKFHLENLTSAACSDDPAVSPTSPPAGFDTYKGTGTGRYNGVAGATAEWTFVDAGEPGKADVATLKVKDVNNNVVLDVSGTLAGGNIQAHNAA